MSELYELPDGWEWKTFDEVSTFIRGITFKPNEKFDEPNGNTIFCFRTTNIQKELDDRDLLNIDSSLIKSEEKIIKNGDILISSANSIELLGKCCLIRDIKYKATLGGFIVCGRANNKILDEKYYYYYFSSETNQNIMRNLANKTTGIANLPMKKVEKEYIPLPPLPEQQRIVSKLDLLFAKIDKAIALHVSNMNEADAFMGSVLNDVFGELEEKYEKIPLFDVADVNRGKSKHRPRNDKKLFGGNYPFIQTGDVRNANKYIDVFSETYSEFGLSQSKLWKKGTICMTIAANIGDVAILNIDSCFPDSVVGIYSENNSNDFLYYFLHTLKQQLESQATTTAQMNINLKVLQTIGVPLPPLQTQKKVVAYLDEISGKIEILKRVQNDKMASLKALKASILDGAFRGEL